MMAHTQRVMDLDAQLQCYAGGPAGPPSVAPYEVNAATVGHWCDAIGDDNPRYMGCDAVAPQTMLQVWVMPGLRPPAGTRTPQNELMALLDRAGFTGVVATDYEQTYARWLRLGERISVTSVIESVSPEKQTRLGRGHFVTYRHVFHDAAGEEVGRVARLRVFKFVPGTGPPSRASGSGAGQPPSPESGEQLPALAIPLTRTLIVAAAIASRDYEDVHHDPERARMRGLRDVIMNILTTNGFVGRYVTDWAGPTATLHAVAIRLGVPNYPGDTMRLVGRVVSKSDGRTTVAIRGANSLGDHVTGTVVLTR